MEEFVVGDRVKVCILPSLGEAGIAYGKIIYIDEYDEKDKYLIEFDDINYISTYYSAEELELL